METAVVAGALANKPLNGGEAWVRLSWALGLRRLGFDVLFVEQIDSADCVDEAGRRAPFERSVNREYFRQVVEDAGLLGSACLVCDEGSDTEGLAFGEAVDRAAGSDLLFNLSGHLEIEALLAGARHRVYVDLDPGFTQMWHAEGSGGFTLAGHDSYVTVGTNVGSADSKVPPGGFEWITTLPPVLLDEWERLPPPSDPRRFTSVATWRSPLGQPVLGDRAYGLKHHEFRRLIGLPQRCPDARFELALAIDPADHEDREALTAGGWHLLDPGGVAGSPGDYQGFISDSAAEISVAQGVYVETRSGWFSDRTACYLAAGRPAVVQDTGLDRRLTGGGGLLTFSDVDGAANAVAAVLGDHQSHSEAARDFARTQLDSDIVLGKLLDRIGGPA